MKNITLIIFTLLLTSLQVFAQENVENKEEKTAEVTETTTPEEPKEEVEQVAILERLKDIKAKRIKIYEFNPIKNSQGFITIIEFNDLSCKECITKSQAFYDSLGQDNLKNVKLIYKHSNSNKTKLVNQTTVYGLVAAKLNKFWEFKEEISRNNYTSNEDLISAIMTAGVTKEELYNNLMLNSDLFYKNIDADDKYAKSLRSKQVPMFYVDGYKVGEDIMPDEVAGYIADRTTEYMNAKKLEDNKYNMGKF
tara:strand:+ start:3148 stop:3900 length:753 start_codon:yes stop_codon:yes gene_type:complete